MHGHFFGTCIWSGSYHCPTDNNILTYEYCVVISIFMYPHCEAALHECKSGSLLLVMQQA